MSFFQNPSFSSNNTNIIPLFGNNQGFNNSNPANIFSNINQGNQNNLFNNNKANNSLFGNTSNNNSSSNLLFGASSTNLFNFSNQNPANAAISAQANTIQATNSAANIGTSAAVSGAGATGTTGHPSLRLAPAPGDWSGCRPEGQARGRDGRR